MKTRFIAAAGLVVLVAAVGHAYVIGYYPGLQKLIDKADAIVILRIDRHLSDFGSPTGYSTHECFIYQSLKGDIPKNGRINLRLMDTEGNFATPYAHGSTHLMFLMKKIDKDEPTDYRTLAFKGAHVLLSPLGQEKAPEGKTVEEKVRNVIRGAVVYEAQEYDKKRKFLETMLDEPIDPTPMGRLGYPIGTYLRIEGVRLDNKNPSSYRIDKVNGRTLDEPVGIWIENLALPRPDPSIRCVINGYERIEWMGEPGQVSKAEGRLAGQLPFQQVWIFRATSIVQPQDLSIR